MGPDVLIPETVRKKSDAFGDGSLAQAALCILADVVIPGSGMYSISEGARERFGSWVDEEAAHVETRFSSDTIARLMVAASLIGAEIDRRLRMSGRREAKDARPETLICVHCQQSSPWASYRAADAEGKTGICPACGHVVTERDMQQMQSPFWDEMDRALTQGAAGGGKTLSVYLDGVPSVSTEGNSRQDRLRLWEER